MLPTMNYGYSRATIILVLVGLLVACIPHKVTAPAVPEFLPEHYSDEGSLSLPDQWWQVFNDEQLNQLMEHALVGNLDLRGAWLRMSAAQASARILAGRRSPSLGASAQIGRSKSSGFPQTGNIFGLGISAGYDVDLFKRLSEHAKAGLLDAEASRSDAESLALMLTASLATTYYSVTEQHLQLSLLLEQKTVHRQLLEIIEARFANGAASAVEVFQQREQLVAVAAQEPIVQARLETLQHLQAALLGRAPLSELPLAERLPRLDDLPKLGLPLQLLEHRPDVRAALRRLEAQDHRLAAAIADRYPSLNLGGEMGFQSGDLGHLFTDWVWSIAGNLVAPLIDGGRRKAEVARNRAEVERFVVAYEVAVLKGLREVEDALSRDRHQKRYIETLEAQYALAQSAYEAGRTRYLRGVGQFLTVLTELQASQRIQRSLLTGRYERIANRISLYQALGGFPTRWGTVNDSTEWSGAH